MAAVMPGTTSTGTPAARSAAISSPPRPNTNGSPPLRRTTCRPAARLAQQDGVDLGLARRGPARRLADHDALGVAARAIQDRRRHQPVGDDDVGLLQGAHRLEGQQIGIARARRRPASPDPCCGRAARELALDQRGRTVEVAGQIGARPPGRRRSRPRTGAGRAPRAIVAAARWRRLAAQRASPPRRAGSIASSRALIWRASTGAAPSVPIATTTGSRSTIAGVMKSHSSCRSTALTGTPGRPRHRHGARRLGIVLERHVGQPDAGEVARRQRPRLQRDAAVARRAPRSRRTDLGRQHADARLGLGRSRIFCAACSPPPTTSTG